MAIPSPLNTGTLRHIENRFDQWHKTQRIQDRYGSLVNAVWNSLHSKHRHFAIGSGLACRYPGDVAPFAALAEPSVGAMEALRALLSPGEAVWVGGESLPHVQGLTFKETIPCTVMVFPPETDLPSIMHEVAEIAPEQAQEMLDLTAIAFPGFFRKRTCEMGRYFGIRVQGKLVAMGGERLSLEGMTEVSGVCTHPDHLGKQYATSIVAHLLHLHRSKGVASFLHVGKENTRAQAIYSRLGLVAVCPMIANLFTRD